MPHLQKLVIVAVLLVLRGGCVVYVVMALLGIGAVIFAVVRSKSKAGLLSVYLVAFGLVCTAEWFAHSIFNMYRYQPGLSLDPHYATAWGILLGEFIFLPSLNVVLVACFRPWLGTVVGTGLVATLEFVYIRLGLFVYEGWQLWLTFATFPFYFGAIGLYWHWAQKSRMKDHRLLAVARWGALMGMVTTMSLAVWVTRLTATDVRMVRSVQGNESFMRLVVHGIGVWLGFWALSPLRWSERWGRIALIVVGMVVINDAFTGLGLLYFLRPFSGEQDAGAIGVITILVGVIMDWVAALAKAPPGTRISAWEPPEI